MTREKFFEHVYPEPNTGCWLWLGKYNRDGYGSLHGDNEAKTYAAHRYSFFIHYGPFQNDLKVLHKCDVRCCVNPDHLFLGTQTDNVRDMDLKGRRKMAYGSSSGLSKINEETAFNIKNLYRTGRYRQIDIANTFNTSRGIVSKVVNNISWKHTTHVDRIKSRYGGGKLSELQIQVIKEAFSAGHVQRRIANYFRISQSYVSNLCVE